MKLVSEQFSNKMILFRILKKKILTKNWNKNKAFIQALPYKNFKHWQKLKPYKKCSAFETKILFFVRFLFQILFLSAFFVNIFVSIIVSHLFFLHCLWLIPKTKTFNKPNGQNSSKIYKVCLDYAEHDWNKIIFCNYFKSKHRLWQC